MSNLRAGVGWAFLIEGSPEGPAGGVWRGCSCSPFLIAGWLEGRVGNQADTSIPLIAHRYERTHEQKKALEYLHWAGEQAATKFANAEAIVYFSRALDLIPETDYTMQYALLLARERVYDIQGVREAQSQDLAAMEKAAEALDDDRRRAEVALRQARYAVATGNFAAAGAAARTAIRLAQADQVTDQEAEGHLTWGQALWRQGDYQAARSQLERALFMARAAQSRQVEADSLRDLGVVFATQGNHAVARAYFEQGMLISRLLGDRWGESASLNHLGVIAQQSGREAGARGYFEHALIIRREIGHRQGEGEVFNNLGALSESQGNYAWASVYYEQALRIYRSVGDRRGEGLALGNLGATFHHLGDDEKAKTYYEQALQICRKIGDRQGEAKTLDRLALLSHQMGHHQAAWQASQQASLIAHNLGDRSLEAYALTHLGHALTGLDRLTEAADAYQQALRLRRELGEHNLAIETRAGLAGALLAQGDLPQAQAQVEEILVYLGANALYGVEEPLRVHLTCYRVLRTGLDPRARSILDTAHSLLQERAAKIADKDMRRAFVENVSLHQEILGERNSLRVATTVPLS